MKTRGIPDQQLTMLILKKEDFVESWVEFKKQYFVKEDDSIKSCKDICDELGLDSTHWSDECIKDLL
jgi:hypothetical protein